MKFKIGDKVKYVKDDYNDYSEDKVHLNHVGRIINVASPLSRRFPYRIKFDDGYENWFSESSLELIDEENNMKFKIGDKVKLTDDLTNNVVLHFKDYINQNAKIIDTNYRYNTYTIKIESDERELEVSENQIKLIEKNILEKSKEEIESEICKDNFIYNLFDLQKLLAIRDKFRNGWKLEQNDQVKYCIEFDFKRGILKTGSYSATQIFSFETSEQRDRFYDLYKDEIEQILKMLML